MKKSFLNRVMAAAMAVPVALSQTVLFASFAAGEDAATGKTIDVNTFIDVPTDPEVAPLTEIGEYTYEQDGSIWNLYVSNALNSLLGKGAYDLDVDALVDAVKRTNGKWYADAVKSATKATVEVFDGSVVITADVNYDKSVGFDLEAEIAAIVADSGLTADEIAEYLDFGNLALQGQFVVTADTSEISASKEIPLTAEITIDGAKKSGANDVFAAIQEKLDTAKADADASTDKMLADYKAAGKNVAAVEDLKDALDDLFAGYQSKLDRAESKTAAYLAKSATESYNGDSVDAVIADVKAGTSINALKNRLADTFSENLQKDTVTALFNEAVNQIGNIASDGGYTVSITLDDVAGVADTFSDVKVDLSLANGKESVAFTAQAPDEADLTELYTYFNEEVLAADNLEIDGEITSYLVVEGSEEADASALTGKVAFNVKRILTFEVKEKVEETTPEPTPEPTTEGPDVPYIELEDIGAEGANGFYFSHDPRPFDATKLIKNATYEKTVDGEVVDTTVDYSKFGFAVDSAAGPVDGLSPEYIYEKLQEETEGSATYTVVSLYIFYDGIRIPDAVATVWIGVKGDATLDGEADALDASAVLIYAANEGSGLEANLQGGNNDTLEKFAYFLAEVTGEAQIESDILDSIDASEILVCSATRGSGLEANWEEILPAPLPVYTAAIAEWKVNNQ